MQRWGAAQGCDGEVCAQHCAAVTFGWGLPPRGLGPAWGVVGGRGFACVFSVRAAPATLAVATRVRVCGGACVSHAQAGRSLDSQRSITALVSHQRVSRNHTGPFPGSPAGGATVGTACDEKASELWTQVGQHQGPCDCVSGGPTLSFASLYSLHRTSTHATSCTGPGRCNGTIQMPRHCTPGAAVVHGTDSRHDPRHALPSLLGSLAPPGATDHRLGCLVSCCLGVTGGWQLVPRTASAIPAPRTLAALRLPPPPPPPLPTSWKSELKMTRLTGLRCAVLSAPRVF